jgi:plasmid maintenance system killer protein
LKILYFDKKTEDYFNNFEEIRKKIGIDRTKILKQRIDQIRASDTFEIFLQLGLGKPHSLKGDLKGGYGIRLNANYRLIVFPVAPNLSAESLKVCETVKIKGVVDYHGEENNKFVIP